ncbi:ETX/MTX2 family pore-forming toxin [Flagellimonas meridianipacifica]|uniref:Toxin ETX/toxin MTX2 n=1 Tax=Flagellimonas meridianipacifica TaxID=1080225 RepID=A0A2T0MDF8_9FLAO|nr:ETX/MTX2 family pore-forming toxin [Allomuricauda pacifica]PRX55515.1 toxin ETX/toxin MTX2 [Allomuricauda pacifica]
MKTSSNVLFRFLIPVLFIVAVACSKDDSETLGPDGNGEIEELAPTITTSEFETDEGQIGISISAREIARKGYKPFTAVISISSSPAIEETVPFDEFNNLANLSFENDQLDDTLENELKEGIAVQVTVRDETNAVLGTQSFSKLSFKANPDEEEIDASGLDDLFAEVNLRPDLKYYMQLVDKDNNVIGAPSSQRYPATGIDPPTDIRLRGNLNYSEEPDLLERFTTYYFERIPGNEEFFSIAVHDGDDIHYLYMLNEQLYIQSRGNLAVNGGNTNVADFPAYWFKIEKDGPGLFKIVPRGTENPLVVSGSTFVTASTSEPDEPNYFRILLFDIDWDVQVIDSQFLKPIMPPSATNSAYNSTLRNCSSGTLTQTIGETTSITTTQTAGYEETMSVSTTNTAGVEVSVEVAYEAEAKFFNSGTKKSIKGSVTGSYEYSKTATETNTKSRSLSAEQSVQVSVSRELGVPPGTAISVADIYQQYQNIKVPFVQRFIISGKYQDDNSDLTGQEILTQFAFNSFTGVVTEVGIDFIEVTVRGTTIIDRLIETSTETRDIANACN